MRRSFAIVFTLFVAGLLCLTQAPRAQLTVTGVGGGFSAGGGGPSSVKWNQADKDAGITLTGSDLIATNNSGSGAAVRATASISGKRYFEIGATSVNTGAGSANVGLANATYNLTSSLLGTTNSFGNRMDGLLLSNFGAIGSCATVGLTAWNTGDTVAVAVDQPSTLVWFAAGTAVRGNWNADGAADPATGTGGCNYSGSVTGALFAAFNTATLTDSMTLKSSSTSWSFPAPSGFTQMP
jgi:hypothetical protein